MLINPPFTYYHKSGKTFSASRFAGQLSYLISFYKKQFPDSPISFLCIGSDRVIGDSLGPVVGYKLEQSASGSFSVIGTLSHPVHAGNLRTVLFKIALSHTPPIVIAIDASVGHPQNVGYITLSTQPLHPGTGVSKNLPSVGHISITGIVSSDSIHSAADLQSIRLGLVMELADSICNGIQVFQQTFAKDTVSSFFS